MLRIAGQRGLVNNTQMLGSRETWRYWEQVERLMSYRQRFLAALDEWGPASQADLGRGTGIDRSDVTAALSELESRRLVERSVDPEHRRRNIVTITPAGAEQLLELDSLIDGIQEQVLKPLTTAQRRQFIALMVKLLAAEDESPKG